MMTEQAPGAERRPAWKNARPAAIWTALSLAALALPGLTGCGDKSPESQLPPPLATATPVLETSADTPPAPGDEAAPEQTSDAKGAEGLPDLFSDLAADTATETSYNVAVNSTETIYNGRMSISEAIEQLNKDRYPVIKATPTPFASQHRQVLDLAPKSAGSASASVIDLSLKTAAGPRAHGRVGDLMLQNENVKLTFAYVVAVDDPSKPLDVYSNRRYDRRQGALIDITLGDSSVDFLTQFTQILPKALPDQELDYDSAEFITRDNPPAVGLRLTGSIFPEPDHVESRIQTIYWLEPGATKVDVETRVTSGPAVPLTDISDWGPCVALTDNQGQVDSRRGAVSRLADWLLLSAGSVSAGMTSPAGKIDALFSRQFLRGVAPTDPEGVQRRTLWLARGDFSAVTDQIFRARADQSPVGSFTGRILSGETTDPATEAWVEILWQERPSDLDDTEGVRKIKFNPQLFTRASCGPDGRFTLLLPADMAGNQGRYFIATGGRARGGARMNQGIVIKANETAERDVRVTEPARLQVKLIDSKTSQTIVGRVKFEPVGDTPNSMFFDIASPDGYLNNFYVPRDGKEIELSRGTYTLTATAGIEYELSKVDVEMEYGSTTPAEILMERSSPSKGYVDLDVGAMTNASPGVMFTAEQRVLMAAGEGLNWIISGDFETLTDFAPVIQKLGLADSMNSSMGFRTYLSNRPEWGEFLIYPVAAGMPDPATARDQWKDMKEAKPFIAKLRELYPGALIESLNPFSDTSKRLGKDGSGYFYMKGWNIYEMAYNDHLRTEELEFDIDAVNIFQARKFWNLNWEKDFLYKNHLHKRFYVPAPVANARVALGGEPGYPRVLIRTDEENAAKVPEAKMFEAMKAGKWQITTGPFIDATFDGRKEGDIYKPEQNANVKYSVTAPGWSTTPTIDIAKDGMMNTRESTPGAIPDSAQRWQGEQQLPLYPDLKGFNDTSASVEITSPDAIPIITQYEFPVHSFALQGPTWLDTNGNKEYDPVKEYRDAGK